MTDHTQRPGGESPVDLVGDVIAGFSRLVRGEFALATAEAKRSLTDAKGALVKLVVAAVLGITALNVLAGAAIAALVAWACTDLGHSGGGDCAAGGGLCSRPIGPVPDQAVKPSAKAHHGEPAPGCRNP